MPTSIEEHLLQKEQEQRNLNRAIVVDFLIQKEGTYFLQKRSPHRNKFPDKWEVSGGHVEADETIVDCIHRELKEETNLELVRIFDILHEFLWEDNRTVNIQVFVEAAGDFQPEYPKISDWRFLTKDELKAFMDTEELDAQLQYTLETLLRRI